MRISGAGGRVRVGYQTAAMLGAWTLTQTRSGAIVAYDVSARLTDLDTFWIQQGPMDLELQMGARIWAWRQVEPTFSAESLAVSLDGVPAIH